MAITSFESHYIFLLSITPILLAKIGTSANYYLLIVDLPHYHKESKSERDWINEQYQ